MKREENNRVPQEQQETCRNTKPIINTSSCGMKEEDPRRVPLISSLTPPPWNRLPNDEMRNNNKALSFLNEQDCIDYHEMQHQEYRLKYYKRDQLLRLSEEVLHKHKFDNDANTNNSNRFVERPIQPDQMSLSPASSNNITITKDDHCISSPVMQIGEQTNNRQCTTSRPIIMLAPCDDVVSISSQEEVDWTKVDSAYGAACPVFGCMPKPIRRAIETTLISFLFLSFILFFVIISVQLTNQHQGGHYNITANSNLVTNDDYYVSNSNHNNDDNTMHDDGYFNNFSASAADDDGNNYYADANDDSVNGDYKQYNYNDNNY